MLKRLLPLALLAAWAPAALAFPPCPHEPLDLVPLDGTGSGEAAGEGSTGASSLPWFKGWYAFVGDPTIIDGIKPITRSVEGSDTGKCRDRDSLPVLDAHLGNSNVELAPTYAPRSGFGLIGLPDLRTVEVETNLRYTLDFTIDNALLPEDDEWFDVAELRFQWQESTTDKGPHATSARYRVRKHQTEKESLAIEVIEVRAAYWGGPVARPPIFQRVVARMPIDDGKAGTRLTLRWNQSARPSENGIIPQPPESGTGTEPQGLQMETVSGQAAQVGSWLEILDASNVVVARIDLPQQWASELSMGLLDYHVSDAADYVGRSGITLEGMTLRAETF